MKHRHTPILHAALALGVAFITTLLAPALALARQVEEREVVDGRLEGYGREVTLHSGSAGLTWLLFIILGVIALAVLFKNAHRTHLD
jgi:hypothetical protein